MYNKMRKLLLREELKKDLNILKEKYHPYKVILFGSLNSGKVNEWSDIDLLIIKETDKPFFERMKEIYLLLEPKVGMDILVYTPKEYGYMKERVFFKNEVLQKGKVLYERK